MMLTGRNVRAGRAKSLGLVDAVVPERHVKAAATAAVDGPAEDPAWRMLIDIVNSSYGRKLAVKRMRAETAKKAPVEHYPAPYALIDLWETHGGNPQDMQKAEIASFARLMVTDTSRNLVRVFFLREKLKSLADGDWSGKRVHVIGAGAMGGDIAAWCAWHGFTVTLADMKAEPLGKAVARAAELYGKIGHKRIEIRDALDRLIPDLSGRGRALRRPRDRGGAGDARAQAQGLCRDRAEDAARRDPRHQHVEHSAARSCARDCSGPINSSACTSSIRSRACSWSRW